jgi:hypothetical protein
MTNFWEDRGLAKELSEKEDADFNDVYQALLYWQGMVGVDMGHIGIMTDILVMDKTFGSFGNESIFISNVLEEIKELQESIVEGSLLVMNLKSRMLKIMSETDFHDDFERN